MGRGRKLKSLEENQPCVGVNGVHETELKKKKKKKQVRRKRVANRRQQETEDEKSEKRLANSHNKKQQLRRESDRLRKSLQRSCKVNNQENIKHNEKTHSVLPSLQSQTQMPVQQRLQAVSPAQAAQMPVQQRLQAVSPAQAAQMPVQQRLQAVSPAQAAQMPVQQRLQAVSPAQAAQMPVQQRLQGVSPAQAAQMPVRQRLKGVSPAQAAQMSVRQRLQSVSPAQAAQMPVRQRLQGVSPAQAAQMPVRQRLQGVSPAQAAQMPVRQRLQSVSPAQAAQMPVRQRLQGVSPAQAAQMPVRQRLQGVSPAQAAQMPVRQRLQSVSPAQAAQMPVRQRLQGVSPAQAAQMPVRQRLQAVSPAQAAQMQVLTAPPPVPARPTARQVPVSPVHVVAPPPAQPNTRQVLAAPVHVSVAKQKPIESTHLKERRIFVVDDHQNCIMSNLASLWKSGKLCDAGISNGSSTIMVHKLVLFAVCPKLFAVLNMDRKSQEFLLVNFPREVSGEALNAFAEYMYNGILDLDPDILEQMKIIAQKLNMTELEQLCDSHLSNHIHQPASASFANLPMQIPAMNPSFTSCGSGITPSMQSSPSNIIWGVNNIRQEISARNPSLGSTVQSAPPISIDIEREITEVELNQMEPADVLSLTPNKSVNTSKRLIRPSVRIERVGPEGDTYDPRIVSRCNQSFASNTSSCLLSSTTAAPSAASSSITTIPISSTEFTIPLPEATNGKFIPSKGLHYSRAPPVSGLSPVSNMVETAYSRSSQLGAISENCHKRLSQPSVSSQPTDELKRKRRKNMHSESNSKTQGQTPHPMRLLNSRENDIILLETNSSDAGTIDIIEIDS